MFATAIARKITVNDLENLDHAGSRPFGSANDPVNTAGLVAVYWHGGDGRFSTKTRSEKLKDSFLDLLRKLLNQNSLEAEFGIERSLHRLPASTP